MSFSHNRINKLAPRGETTTLYFSRTLLLHSMRVAVFDFAILARYSFPCCAFPPFRRIYSVVPRQWKKRHFLPYPSVASQSFALTSYLELTGHRVSAPRERYSTPLLSRASSLHAHVCSRTRTRDGRTRKLRFRHPRWATTASFIREKLHSFASLSTFQDLWYNISGGVVAYSYLSMKIKLASMIKNSLVINFIEKVFSITTLCIPIRKNYVK